jgi:DNA end-binding protein Ku
MLELLRYQHEVRKPEELHLPEGDAKKLKISEAELKMAERLIQDLVTPWKPEEHKDDYRDRLMEFIQKKAESGKVEEVETPEKPKAPAPPADVMKLLKASVAHAETSKGGKAPRGRVLH